MGQKCKIPELLKCDGCGFVIKTNQEKQEEEVFCKKCYSGTSNKLKQATKKIEELETKVVGLEKQLKELESAVPPVKKSNETLSVKIQSMIQPPNQVRNPRLEVV